MSSNHGNEFKLGKLPAQLDKRNIKFSSILRAQAEIPDTYDFDASHPGVPLPMFANDSYGDCVIAGRAHQTLRFELLEQKLVISITNQDVLNEYLKETGGADVGLVVLPSLKRWRRTGWKAASHTYKILGFAELDHKNAREVSTAIYADTGVGIGVLLPSDAKAQIHAGKPWDVTSGPGSEPGSWGGHYMFVSGYNPVGPVCVTWGRKQQATWKWLEKYCDESYAIFDAKNNFKTNIIDVDKLRHALAAVS